MTALESLIRIHRWQVDESRRQVSELETLAEKLRLEMARLAEERQSEQKIAADSFEAQHAFPGYIRQALDRTRTLERSLAEVDGQIMQARDALAAAFQELKRYEIASANRERHRMQSLARRERAELEGVALETYRRRGESGGNGL